MALPSRGRALILAAGIAGVATLVRPEGGLLAMTVVAWGLVTEGRRTWQAVLAAAVPMAIAGAAIFARYGSPLPNSVAAKQVAYQPAWPLENAFALLMQAGLPGWSTYLLAALPGAAGLILALIGFAALVELARRAVPALNERGVSWQPFAGFAMLYLVFYVMVGLRGVRLFPWYLVPIEPFYLLAAAAGLARLVAPRSDQFGAARDDRLGALCAAPLGVRSGARLRGFHAALLAAVLMLWQLPAIDWRQPLMPAGQDLAREQLYLDIGRDLAESLPPNAVIAAPEIGALGYASNLRVLDTVGLISPAALSYYPLPAAQLVTDNAIPARLIADRQPDAVVTLDAFAQRSLLPDPAFQRDYRLEAAYPAAVWQSQQLLVFRRTDR